MRKNRAMMAGGILSDNIYKMDNHKIWSYTIKSVYNHDKIFIVKDEEWVQQRIGFENYDDPMIRLMILFADNELQEHEHLTI